MRPKSQALWGGAYFYSKKIFVFSKKQLKKRLLMRLYYVGQNSGEVLIVRWFKDDS